MNIINMHNNITIYIYIYIYIYIAKSTWKTFKKSPALQSAFVEIFIGVRFRVQHVMSFLL